MCGGLAEVTDSDIQTPSRSRCRQLRSVTRLFSGDSVGGAHPAHVVQRQALAPLEVRHREAVLRVPALRKRRAREVEQVEQGLVVDLAVRRPAAASRLGRWLLSLAGCGFYHRSEGCQGTGLLGFNRKPPHIADCSCLVDGLTLCSRANYAAAAEPAQCAVQLLVCQVISARYAVRGSAGSVCDLLE